VPSEREYLAAYCDARGVPRPPAADWAFFLALSLFRAAAILAGVGARARQGNASSAQAGAVRESGPRPPAAAARRAQGRRSCAGGTRTP
jgi:aminoglycoside phosphotransferase (APT) family kinase protein